MRVWRLIRSGHLSGAMNMAVDEAIMRSVAEGGPPTLRFYGWEPPAISIGYFQDAEKQVDFAACKSVGVDVVRRPTGGRAVLHDVEVTYSLALPEENPIVPKGITESYREISEGMVRGLRRLGLDAKMVALHRRRPGDRDDGEASAGWEGTAPGQEGALEAAGSTGQGIGPRSESVLRQESAPRVGAREHEVVVEEPARSLSSAACFDAPSWYEVTVGGKKIVGSAQVRRMGVLLQHGSILLDLDAEKLFTCLRFSSDSARRRAMEKFLEKATSIWAVLDRPVSFMETSEAVLQGLAERLGVEFREGELTPAEKKMAEQLAATKYCRLDWNRSGGSEGIQTA